MTHITVTINVTNVDEPGTVTLSSPQPQEGTELTASLTDPDGGHYRRSHLEMGVFFEPEPEQCTWAVISTATSATVHPEHQIATWEIPAGHGVLHRPGQGSDKTAEAVSDPLCAEGAGGETPSRYFTGDTATRSVAENTVSRQAEHRPPGHGH